jgi:hypothetical protein
MEFTVIPTLVVSPLSRPAPTVLGILGFTVAVRPVFLPDLNKIDENVLAPQPDCRMKAVGNGLVERLFLFNSPAFVPGNLDNYELLGAVDTEIVRVEQEVLGAVLAKTIRPISCR